MVYGSPTHRSKLEWVRRFGHGDLIAVSSLQPDMRWFETSFGAWPYRRVRGIDITLGGPLCAAEDRHEMVRRFSASSRWPVFFYLREGLLSQFDGAGLHCAGIGVDRYVDCEALLSSPRRAVRGALKQAARAGLRVREISTSGLDSSEVLRFQALNRRYLERAQVPIEMGFLNRPMTWKADGIRRMFALEKFDREHQGVFGFAVLNPIFDAGQITGYLLDILRFDRTRVWGVWLSVVHELAERVAAEGAGLSVGFCPLHGAQPAPVGGSRALQSQVDWMARNFSTVQYLQRLREMKSQIPGTTEPRYFASFTRLAPVALYALVEAMGVPFRSLIGPRLIEALREARDPERASRGGQARATG